MLTIQAFGERALLLQFDNSIDPEVNLQVHHYAREIKSWNDPHISQLIPAYNSLTVFADFTKLDRYTVIRRIENIELTSLSQSGRHLYLPVCYETEFALDIELLSKTKQIAKEDIENEHCSIAYLVYMIGFLPGFAYLGKVTPAIQIRRKKKVRISVPAGSVGIAGSQTGIYPTTSPGGWQIIGNCPVSTFTPYRDDFSLFQPGDVVSFYPITKREHKIIKSDIALHNFNWNELYQ